jgi:hypothetical protein
MKITYNHLITTLKVVTTVAFVGALGFKLYNIYKYGGPKKPEKPIEPIFEDEDGDIDVDSDIDVSGEIPKPSYYKVVSENTYSER